MLASGKLLPLPQEAEHGAKEQFKLLQKFKESMVMIDNYNGNYRITPTIKFYADTIKESGFSFDDFKEDDFKKIIEKIEPEYRKLTPKTNFIKTPIGRLGRERFYFELGEKDEIYHGLIAGQSGSGKSVLLNYIIAQIMRDYSPEQVQFYLMDCKSGVEFNIFKKCPHVRTLVSISDVNKVLVPNIKLLKTFTKEMQKRAALFKELSEENADCQKPPIKKLSDYNHHVASSKQLPHIIIVIDEVQELAEDHETKDDTKKLLKDFARQGRSFGVHLILCSQGFGNYFYNDIVTQMKLRIALSLTKDECYNVLSARNTIPSTKDFQAQPGKPRKVVYNTNSGMEDGNEIIVLDSISDEHIAQLISEVQEKYTADYGFNPVIIDDSYDLNSLNNELGYKEDSNNNTTINSLNSNKSNTTTANYDNW